MAIKEPSLSSEELKTPTAFDDRIEKIVEANMRSGRFQRVCNHHRRILTRSEYTSIVKTHYTSHHELVSSLEQGHPAAWQQLWQRLFYGAYHLLIRRGWDPPQARVRAQEAVQDTCLSIYCRVYPYDCPFDAWVLIILRHYVFRSHHRPRNPLDLPHKINPLENLPDQTAPTADFVAIEQQELLFQALGNLRSQAQRQVIDYLFFQQLSPQETAQKMGKTVQAIYNLKGRALANLQQRLKNHQVP